jgi:hypothetical protein
MKNVSKVKDVAISILALGGVVTACSQAATNSSSSDLTMNPLSIPGVAVPACDSSSRPISRVVLVHLDESLDDLVSNATRAVYYRDYTANSTPDDDNLNDMSNGADAPSNWVDLTNETNDIDNATGNIIVPYSIDTGQMGTPLPSGSWTQIRFLLRDDGSANATKLVFFKSKHPSDPTKVVRGITVDNPDIVTQKEICVEGDAAKDNHGATVLSVFLLTPSAQTTKNYRFTIALRAKSGAISTPITIDPKIYNNG